MTTEITPEIFEAEAMQHIDDLYRTALRLTRDAGDAARVFPGDGDFDLAPLVERLRTIGYAGAVSVELMNPVVWQAKPSQVAELAMTALARLLGPSR